MSLFIEITLMFKDTPLLDFNKYYIDVINDISHYRYGDMFCDSCEWADLCKYIYIKITDYINNKFIGKRQ